jgi:hypothetical protein
MHHEHPAPAASPFPPDLVEAFHADDKRAAATIVLLMCGIFTTGLVLYLGVCWAVLS